MVGEIANCVCERKKASEGLCVRNIQLMLLRGVSVPHLTFRGPYASEAREKISGYAATCCSCLPSVRPRNERTNANASEEEEIIQST